MSILISCFKNNHLSHYQAGFLMNNTVITVYNNFFDNDPQLNEVSITIKFTDKTLHFFPLKISYFHSKNLLDSFREFFSFKIETYSPVIAQSPKKLATFVCLECCPKTLYSNTKHLQGFVYSKDIFVEGENLVVSFNPFFRQPVCYISGIVSSVVKLSPNIILTDAKSCEGFEGAPIYRKDVVNEKILSGMILSRIHVSYGNPPICKSSGLSLGIHLSSIDDLISQCVFPSQIYKAPLTYPRQSKNFDFLALIVYGSGVGSGINICEQGLVLTNGHVVNYKTGVPVKVFLSGKEMSGKVIFSTNQSCQLDCALVELDSYSDFPCCTFSDEAPIHGEHVFSIGHFIDGLKPMKIISEGVLSYTKHFQFLTADCICVPCCSGGAVMRSNGDVIGLVFADLSSQQEENNDGLCLCVAMPLYFLRKSLIKFIQSRDINIMKKMVSEYEQNFHRAKL